jgi:hypothetical protein
VTRRKCNSLLTLIMCVVVGLLAFGISKLFDPKTLGTNICSALMVVSALTIFGSLVVMFTEADSVEQKKAVAAKAAK